MTTIRIYRPFSIGCSCGWFSASATREGALVLAEEHGARVRGLHRISTRGGAW